MARGKKKGGNKIKGGPKVGRGKAGKFARKR